MLDKNLLIYKNNFGVYYVGDSKGNEQYYDFCILAHENKEYLQEILDKINNGTIEKWWNNQKEKQRKKQWEEYKEAGFIHAVKYKG